MSNLSSSALPGKVFTFYSYKGGVGRTMALVNVGVLLALSEKRVLLIDWDLEAPGLETYFRNAGNLVGDPKKVPGIVNLLEARMSSTTLDWRNCRLKAKFLGCSLDIISAGSRTPDYRRRLQRLDWESLYNEHHIGNFVNDLRDQWRLDYDFILVDSRTGITDIGDICTVLLPDILVLMFVSNHQNIEGIKNIVARAVETRRKLPLNSSKLISLPVPARDEAYNEYTQALEWKQIYARELGYLYDAWLPREVTPGDALNKLFIPYVTNWSFGERIPVLESSRETQDPTTIGGAYKRLANLMANGLDWYALEGKTTVEDLQGTQIELLHAREQNEAFRQKAFKEKRARWIVSIASLFVALASFIFFYLSTQKPVSTELFLGRDLFSQGKIEESLNVFEARKKLLEETRAPDPNDKSLLTDLGDSYFWIGEAQNELGRLSEALINYRLWKDTIEQKLSVTSKKENTLEIHRIQVDLSSSHHRIGNVLEKQGQLPEALASFREDKAIMEKLVEADPSNLDWHADLSTSHNRIGNVLAKQGQLKAALVSLRKDRAITEKLVAAEPSNLAWQESLSSAHRGTGIVLEKQGQLPEALASFREDKAIMEKLVAAEPSTRPFQMGLSGSHSWIGQVLEKQGKLTEALVSSRDRKAIMEKLVAAEPSKRDWQLNFANSLSRIGWILIQNGELYDAESPLIQALKIYENQISLLPTDLYIKWTLTYQYKRLGLLEQARAQPAKAQAWFEKAETILEGLGKSSPTYSDIRLDSMEIARLKSEAMLLAEKPSEALTAIERSLVLYKEITIEPDAQFFWEREYVRDLVQLGRAHAWRRDQSIAAEVYNKAGRLLDRLVTSSPTDAELAKTKVELSGFVAALKRR